MVINWWDTNPWWAQGLIVIGGIVVYTLIGIITHYIAKKTIDDNTSDEGMIMMAVLWPAGLPFILASILIKLVTIPFKLEEDVQIIKQDVREIKNLEINKVIDKDKKNKK